MEKLDAYAKIKFLVNELNKHTEFYDAGKPIISDSKWDDMYFELQKLEQEWEFILPESPTQRVNYAVVNELTKVKHNHPMLSLDKTKDWGAFVNYFGHHDVVGMLKMDGLTLSLRYIDGRLTSAETRGDGEVGEDVLHNALGVKNIPKKIDYKDELVIDGEIVCTTHGFEAFKDEYANPRNFAAGSIRLLDSRECAKRNLKFIAWNVVVGPYNTVIDNFTKIDSLGFTVVPWTSSWDWDAKEFLLEKAEEYGYPIDGLVGRFNDINYGESLGSTGHHSRAAYAFKMHDELYETKLLDIEWTLGRTGQLTPTAVFEPVWIEGSEVSRASIHNVSIMKKLALARNCTVQVFKANCIIPQVFSAEQDGDEDFRLPDVCPVCGETAEVQKDIASEVLVCTNPNCSGKQLSKLTHFVSRNCMDIRGLSEATLETLISLGFIHNYKDIYHLSKHRNKLILIDGYGPKSIDNILQAIEKSRDVELAAFITALGIPNIGGSAAKTISEHFKGSYEDFINAYFYWHFDWTTLEDFGQVMADSINTYLHDNLEMVNELAAEMRFVQQERKEPTNGLFNGKTICVTGKMHRFTRDGINTKIIELGAKTASSVSTKTDYLITNEQSNSSKYKKAVELNIPIITEDDFLKMCGE